MNIAANLSFSARLYSATKVIEWRNVPVMILLGIAGELFASASGMLSLGRPGFLLAASGILAADGRLDVRR